MTLVCSRPARLALEQAASLARGRARDPGGAADDLVAVEPAHLGQAADDEVGAGSGRVEAERPAGLTPLVPGRARRQPGRGGRARHREPGVLLVAVVLG